MLIKYLLKITKNFKMSSQKILALMNILLLMLNHP